MASSMSSLSGQTKQCEPSPRFGHRAAQIGGRCYLWGGRVQDFSESRRKKLASTIEIFDPYSETWKKHPTIGVPPSGLYSGACASTLDSLYWFGGRVQSTFSNSLHRLDSITLEWTELQPLNPADGPMKKSGCGMVSFLQDKLTTFGGYGIPSNPTNIQQDASFVEDTRFTDGKGWNNQLHMFDIAEGMYCLIHHTCI